MFVPKPHVSDALVQLGRAAWLCAIVLCVGLVLRLFVWAFVHYTDVRWSASPSRSAPALVVHAADVAVLDPVSPAAPSSLGPHDTTLRAVTSLTAYFGPIVAFAFALVAFQAVVVAGGASVPGVQGVVSASLWSAVVALLCAPLDSALSTAPSAGAFGGYDRLVTMSEAVVSGGSGGFARFAEFVGLPVLTMLLVGFSMHRLRWGIEQGVVVTSVNDLDDELEREMSRVSQQGAVRSSRAVGALDAALGAAAAGAPGSGASVVGSPGGLSGVDRSRGSMRLGSSGKRPI